MKFTKLVLALALATKSNASNDVGAWPVSRKLNAAVPVGVPVYLNFRVWNQVIAVNSCNDNAGTTNGGEGAGGDQNNNMQHWKILSDGKIESVGCPDKYLGLYNNNCHESASLAIRSSIHLPTQQWTFTTHPVEGDRVYMTNTNCGAWALGKNGYHGAVVYAFNPNGSDQKMTLPTVPGYYTPPPTNSPTDRPTAIPTPPPTNSPTETPTAVPTPPPTNSPTVKPTAVPTVAPWEIVFKNVTSDLSPSSTDELVLVYLVGNTRTYQHQLYAGKCNATVASNTIITGFADDEYNVTDSEGSVEDSMMALTISYSLDKSKLTGSNIWYNETANASKLELCQVVQLYALEDNEDPNSERMVIVEDIRDIQVNIDMSVDFLTNVTLDGATINAQQQNTTLESFIIAFKCQDIDDNEADDTDLVPNTELSICIKSVADEVDIDAIVSMDIDGRSPDGQASNLPVMVNKAAVLVSLTSFAYSSDGNRAIVTTRVPTNLFDFEDPNANIAVTGTLVLKLSDGTRRRLAINKPVRALQAAVAKATNNEQAGFELNINLQPGTEGADLEGEQGPNAMMNSAKGAAGKGLALLGMAAASAYALW